MPLPENEIFKKAALFGKVTDKDTVADALASLKKTYPQILDNPKAAKNLLENLGQKYENGDRLQQIKTGDHIIQLSSIMETALLGIQNDNKSKG